MFFLRIIFHVLHFYLQLTKALKTAVTLVFRVFNHMFTQVCDKINDANPDLCLNFFLVIFFFFYFSFLFTSIILSNFYLSQELAFCLVHLILHTILFHTNNRYILQPSGTSLRVATKTLCMFPRSIQVRWKRPLALSQTICQLSNKHFHSFMPVLQKQVLQ